MHQTAIGLAVAEKALELEHRDLHWGNVLVRRTEEQFIKSILDGRRKVVESHGVHVSIIIIDFTFSRIKKVGVTLFNNLSEDEDLFTGCGDYEFEVHRLMRESKKNWKPFEHHTNVLWLHYLAKKLFEKRSIEEKIET
ncbi:hypothetical protein ACROYT_G013236 [Oculina patagonica]